MKKLMMVLMLSTAGTICFKAAKAQVNISINIGNQPAWGPTGYDHVDYYYLPDINCYYDVAQEQFLYLSGGRWLYTSILPQQYSNYDLYKMYKVVVNQRNPYLYNATHVRKYGQYKGNRTQANIRDSKDEKYYASKGHPNHNSWVVKQNNARSTNTNKNANPVKSSSPEITRNSSESRTRKNNKENNRAGVNSGANTGRQAQSTEHSNNNSSKRNTQNLERGGR